MRVDHRTRRPCERGRETSPVVPCPPDNRPPPKGGLMMVARHNRRWERMDKTGTPLEALFKTYELYNRSEALSERTIAWYADKLFGYLRWLQSNGNGSTLSDFTLERVREYVLYLQSKEVKHERNPYVPTKYEKLSGHTIRGYVKFDDITPSPIDGHLEFTKTLSYSDLK